MAANNQNFAVPVTLRQMVNDQDIVDDGSRLPVVELIVDTYSIKGHVIESILKRLPRVNKITLKPTDDRYLDVGSQVKHWLGWKDFAAEVLKSDLTITSLSMSVSGTKYFIGSIKELVMGKCISSLSIELDRFTIPRHIDLISFRSLLTNEDCPVTDLRIVMQSESALASFIKSFDDGPPNQTTRIKHLTLEQCEKTPYSLGRDGPWERLRFNKRATRVYDISTLASNVRALTLKGFYLEESTQRSLAHYLLSPKCKPLIAVCLVNIRSLSDPTGAVGGAAKVVKEIEESVSSQKCLSTYKAIFTSNGQKTQHACVLVKWVTPLSNATKIQVAFLHNLANNWKSFMTRINNEFSVDRKTNELEFAVNKEILELMRAATQQAMAYLCREEPEGRPSLSGNKRPRPNA